MNDHELSRINYEALLRTTEPHCLGCLDMNPSVFDWRAVCWATSYPNLDPHKIASGARNQCPSCVIIYAAFQGIGLDFHVRRDIQHVFLYKKDRNDSLQAFVLLDEKLHIVEFYTIKNESPSPWSIIEEKTHLTGNTASEASFHCIQQWIHDCTLKHKRCLNQTDAGLPTRVLDLGESNDCIKLFETNGLSSPYICLSHCWGQSSTILCTRQNYNDYQNSIPWVSLPRLFQDTVKICRMLGIRYLWIDKLCIIQHDTVDWANEGSKMAQTFEGSFLTIGAAVSKDDTQPLFFQDGIHFPSLKSHIGQIKQGSWYTIYSRIPFSYHPASATSTIRGHERYPLMTRAWVYQERLLAPRVLYFGQELSWECREESVCECSGARHGMKYDHSLSLVPGFSSEKLYLRWQKMVEDFTWLHLSHEEDRLPALSGLAQQYHYRLKSGYLAGLWKENLLADLIWFSFVNSTSEAPRYSTKRTKKWRAPSWSWASVEGPILFSNPNPFEDVDANEGKFINWSHIISAECTPLSSDTTGTVANGKLIIKGRGRPASLKHRESGIGQETRHFTVKQVDTRSVHIDSNFTVDGHEANVDYDIVAHGLMEPNSDMSVYCLYIGGMSFVRRIFVKDLGDYDLRPVFKTWSLLLCCVDDKIFERVGLLISEHNDKEESQIRNSLDDCVITII